MASKRASQKRYPPELRERLINSDHDAIALIAAELADLQRDFGLCGREAAIAYAFGASGIDGLRETNWSGPQASFRGRYYDAVSRRVSGVL